MKILMKTKTCDYPLDSTFFNPFNKRVFGKMNDEFEETIVSAFVGLN